MGFVSWTLGLKELRRGVLSCSLGLWVGRFGAGLCWAVNLRGAVLEG